MFLSLVLGGCQWVWHWPPWEQPEGVVWRPGSAPAGGDDEEMFAPSIFVVEVRVIPVEVPVGIASGSEKLWSYLDEERSRAVRSATMAQNGVRLGVAAQGVWPDLAKVLQEMTGRKLVESVTVTSPGTPLKITLKPDQGKQTIFTIARDRTISGRDFPPGDNELILNFSINELDYSKLIVTGVPQIRAKERTSRVVDVPGMGPTIAIDTERFSLEACTFQLMLANSEILIVGPGAESRRPNSIGRHFLVHQKDGLECETVLVIVPTIRKVAIKQDILTMPSAH